MPASVALRRTGLVAGLVVLAFLPLAVVVAVSEDRLLGFGLGFVVTGGWVLLLALTVQITRARRVQRRAAAFPGPAGRRHDAREVAEAMLALAPPDWTGLRLEVDDDGRRATVTRLGGLRSPLAPLSPAVHAAIDQLDASTRRSDAPFHRLVLAASRDGTAKVTVE